MRAKLAASDCLMPDIFISHASPDDDFVNRVHDTLEKDVKDCQAWVDHLDLLAGDGFDDRINAKITGSNYLLLVVSQHSLKSKEVNGECRKAMLNNIPLLVAIIDDTPFKDLPHYLLTLNAVNLKKEWDAGIALLVKTLNGDATPTDEPLFKRVFTITGTIDRRLTQTPLRGRDADVAAIKAALAKAPTVIVGVGGLGKSKLAAEVALTGDAWQGVIWQRVSEFTQVYDVIELMKQHFELPPTTERRDVLAKLKTQKTLVVLDNAEDVPPTDPRHKEYVALVNDLLTHGAQVLITSRVEWEALNPVTTHEPSPLDADASRQLVLDLGAAYGVKNLDNQADAIAEAARKHPRLIEFAIGQMKRFPPTKILTDLRDLTSRKVQDAMDEMIEKTLRQMVMADEHGALAEQVLKRLLVCRGGFTLAAAEAIGGMAGDDLDAALTTLQIWQFVTYNREKERYDLPQIVIAALPPDTSAHRPHFDYYHALARAHEKSADHEKYLKLDVESENLEAAFEWAMGVDGYEQALWLVTSACGNYLMNRGRFEHLKNWLERVATGVKSKDIDSSGHSVDNRLAAAVQNSLGNLYGVYPFGDHQTNLKQAVAAYEAVLVYWTPQSAPLGYAMTQNNLGTAYRKLAGVEDKIANLKQAVEAHKAALVYFTPQSAPLSYAATQNNLGTVYRDLAEVEDRADNLKRAISAYEAALMYYTPQFAPLDYAMTQNNLGTAYCNLAEVEDRTGNLKRAVVVYKAALVYRTPQSAPLDYALTQRNLGIVYEDLGETAKSIGCWREAECYYRQMGHVKEADLMLEWITETPDDQSSG
ncbi:MAG: TIR domain-containing protein [Anaerolineae bacterium]|nr:TIR domain-containing protein [Anaerolineae bacterium]